MDEDGIKLMLRIYMQNQLIQDWGVIAVVCYPISVLLLYCVS